MNRIWIIVVGFLLLTLLPFLACGPQLEALAMRFVTERPDPGQLAGALILLLGLDIFLPVPSSGLITYCGSQLGMSLTAVLATFGLTIGNACGYELARLWGTPLVEKFASENDRRMLARSFMNGGIPLVIISRPLPVLSEAVALLAGCATMPRSTFYPAAILSNAALGIIYSTLGSQYGDEPYFLWIVLSSMLIPLGMTWLARVMCGSSTSPVEVECSVENQNRE
ncbi:MAG: VTT domain-containing protein [Planctomycetaceae bacterium]|nr:VTT domain-containing protein [Planctomycetaceae bacterium]